MADPKKLPSHVAETSAEERVVLEVGETKFFGARIDLNRTDTLHLTREAAMALTESARFTHAVPAEEATKQAIEETKREKQTTIQFAILALVVVAASALIAYEPKAGTAIAATVGVFGVVWGAKKALDRWSERKRKKTDA